MSEPRPARVLCIDAKLPTPERDAASQRSLQLLGQLIAWGFDVDFGAFPSAAGDRSPLDELGVRVLDANTLNEHIGGHPNCYDIVVLSWTRVASRLLGAVRAANPNAYVVFDTHDVNHVREFRHAKISGNARILRRAVMTKQRELACVAAADCTLAISEADAQTLRAACPAARVEVVTMRAPTLRSAPAVGDEGRRGMLLLGSLQAVANVDAALHLAHDVLPELRRIGGDTRTTIAGSQTPDVVSSLDNGSDIRVTGDVEDLEALFDEHLIFACPLRFGSGIKGKVLTTMALGLPAVITPVAAEGMELEHEREVLIAETPAAFAAALLRLQQDAGLRTNLTQAAAEHVLTRHSAGVLESQMRRVFSPRCNRGSQPSRSA